MSANIFLVSSLAILCPMYDLKDDSISRRTSGEKRLFSFFWSFKAISKFFLLQQFHTACDCIQRLHDLTIEKGQINEDEKYQPLPYVEKDCIQLTGKEQQYTT